MEERIAKFRLKNYVIDNASIKFDKNNIPKDMKVEIKRGGSKEVDNEYHFSIAVKVSDKEKGFELIAECSSVFEFDKALTEEELERYAAVNAPAILFPYVRAYVSTLTSLSGITPIVLPTINLAAYKG